MEITELMEIIACGEDSKHQFKVMLDNDSSLAAEMVAFSNAQGGKILVGVSDDGTVKGLTFEDVRKFNAKIAHVASQMVKPAINPETENIYYVEGLVMVISVPAGISKPYMDNAGAIWVKCGSDKRKVTSREELQRMFQASGLVHADEIPANGITVADIDYEFFATFYEKTYGERIDGQDLPLPQLLENMNLAKQAVFNLAGALLFAQKPQFRLPNFIVKAVVYPQNSIDADRYLDSRDIVGKMSDVFHQTVSFIRGNIMRVQGAGTVNSEGEMLVPQIVFDELLVNALVHRDYFIPAPVRIFMFSDRIEIISPGHLPNNLNIEHIKAGNSNIRNPVLASFATKLLPYRGLGNGVRRALNAYPAIDFIDDREGNLFKVTINI